MKRMAVVLGIVALLGGAVFAGHCAAKASGACPLSGTTTESGESQL